MRAIGYQFVPYLWLSIGIVLLVSGLIAYAWRNRAVLGARYFLVTLILVDLWIIAQALEIAALDLPTKILWANVQYGPIMLTSVTYLCLALQFTRHEKWLEWRWLPLLLLVAPLVANILVWTSGSHGLIRQNVHLNLAGAFPTVGKTYGPAFWALAAYNYLINILAIVTLVKELREKIALHRKQIVSLIVAILIPVASNLFFTLGFSPLGFDTTPPIFGLSALIISWGIFRYRLFDVVPVARSIIIQEMRIGMIVLDDKGRFLDINPAARRMFNLVAEPLSGHSLEDELGEMPELIGIYRQGRDAVCELTLDDGPRQRHYEVSFTQLADSRQQFIGWLLQVYDITERKTAEGIIQQAARHDPLTGLPNRSYFQALLAQELARAKATGRSLLVAYLDLDGFKAINDTHGHDVGDRVLSAVAQRLKGVLRESDIVSRIGGDEYTLAFPGIEAEAEIKDIGDRILQALQRNLELPEASLQIRASIGFSRYPRDGESIDALLRTADQAMYVAKDLLGNRHQIHGAPVGKL